MHRLIGFRITLIIRRAESHPRSQSDISQPHNINTSILVRVKHIASVRRKTQEPHNFQTPIGRKLPGIARRHHRKSIQEIGKPPYAKFRNCCRCCKAVARCCKVEYLSKLKSENRETTTIEISVVDYPQNDEKAFFEIFMQCCRHPRFLQLLKNPVTRSLLPTYTILLGYCSASVRRTHPSKRNDEVSWCHL